MKAPKLEIWTKYFFKSFVWLILPICLLGNVKSCSIYNVLGEAVMQQVNLQGETTALWLGDLSGGIYHVILFDPSSGKSYSENLLISSKE